MKLLILLFIISINAHSAECFIKSFDKVIYNPSAKSAKGMSIIRDSNCSEEIKNSFLDAIFKSTGTMTSRSLNQISSNKNTTINLSPSKIQIINLEEELTRQFNLPQGWSFGRLRFVNKNTTLGLSNDQRFEFECDLCHTTGEKTLSLKVIDPIKNRVKNHWVQGMVFISTNVLIPKRPVSPSETQLSPSFFTMKTVKVTRPEKYFTNLDQLVFYKVNKPLTGERGLMFTDLIPVNLVSPGIPAKLILKRAGITLSGKGIPSQPGKYGEIIKLRNPKTNKMITGKVIDFNKVVVDL